MKHTHRPPRPHSLRFWVTERRVYQERLATELKAAADTCELEAQVADKDAAIGAAHARILALRSQVQRSGKDADACELLAWLVGVLLT
jgi:hypothetical protein